VIVEGFPVDPQPFFSGRRVVQANRIAGGSHRTTPFIRKGMLTVIAGEQSADAAQASARKGIMVTVVSGGDREASLQVVLIINELFATGTDSITLEIFRDSCQTWRDKPCYCLGLRSERGRAAMNSLRLSLPRLP
jgi:hypothetical protein